MDEQIAAMPEAQESDTGRAQAPAGHPSHTGEVLWNALTLLLVVAFLGSLIYFGLVFTNPTAAYNVFPPPTLVPALAMPTPLPTRTLSLPVPTQTLAATLLPNPSATPIPPTPTAIQATPLSSLIIENSPTPTVKAVNSVYSFVLQADPKAVDGTLFDPTHGCTWMGVAGRAYDLQNGPVTKLEVQLFGILDGNLLSLTSLTGTSTQYGPSGFEFTLASQPVASNQRLWIRLVDQAGVPLSDRIFFDTYADCAKNLVVINFKQVK